MVFVDADDLTAHAAGDLTQFPYGTLSGTLGVFPGIPGLLMPFRSRPANRSHQLLVLILRVFLRGFRASDHFAAHQFRPRRRGRDAFTHQSAAQGADAVDEIK